MYVFNLRIMLRNTLNIPRDSNFRKDFYKQLKLFSYNMLKQKLSTICVFWVFLSYFGNTEDTVRKILFLFAAYPSGHQSWRTFFG